MYNDLNDFATIDNNLVVCAGVEEATSDQEDRDEDGDDGPVDENDNEPVNPAPSREEMYAALDTLKNYAATNNISPSLFECINKVTYECAFNLTPKTYKQTNIKNCLKE